MLLLALLGGFSLFKEKQGKCETGVTHILRMAGTVFGPECACGKHPFALWCGDLRVPRANVLVVYRIAFFFLILSALSSFHAVLLL
jgi:hypothetical protein